ncbi:hypothetical protein [Vulgatibacter incomptus]|uniref:Uncharacterized protein n=1 Tax=Vulgatibacter incomptus TaxID=1391653 RepID=A0A0K1PG73_9BACT|nr:hypothetical protein [Vulgatibacter incomptus]AKU92533.1 hypothetical protein AKJ08_2920 [Vulgatibacter incomptus]
MLRKSIFLVAMLFAVGTACNGSNNPDNTGGTGGGTGGTGGTAGGGTGGTAGSEAGSGGTDTGGTGGTGTGGTGGTGTGGTGGPGTEASCREMCDAVADCGLAFNQGTWDADECTRQCESGGLPFDGKLRSCIVEAMVPWCDTDQLDECFNAPIQETAACTAMCDHLYTTCDSGLGELTRVQCGQVCSNGALGKAPKIACLTEAACGTDAVATCFHPGESEACSAFCDHAYLDCGYTMGSNTRVDCGVKCTNGSFGYTPEMLECAANAECAGDPPVINECFKPTVSPECKAMCDNLDECGTDGTIFEGLTRDECSDICMDPNQFDDAQIACWGEVACDPEAIDGCLAPAPFEPSAECVQMCAHITSCQLSLGFTETHCQYICGTEEFSDDLIGCILDAPCVKETMQACFAANP